MAKIYISTSGWNYDHWRGPFYPEESLENMLNVVEAFGYKLEPVLFQLRQTGISMKNGSEILSICFRTS